MLGIFAGLGKMPLLCTRFDEVTTFDKQGSQEKVLKNIPKRFGCFENLPYLCTRFDEVKISSKATRFLRKSFQKIFQKDLEIRKTCLTFASALIRFVPYEKQQGSQEKFFEKYSEKIWMFEKLVLPLHHFPLRKSGWSKRKVLSNIR